MNEFNNRIDAQREILNFVNAKPWREELYGLSNGAIDRWIHANGISSSSEIAATIYEAAGKLFFLANRSQEQITDEYRLLSGEVAALAQRISCIIGGIS